MSKLVKIFAALVLIAGAFAIAPDTASAQRRAGGGWHHGGGWHGGGWHGGGWRGGYWRGGRRVGGPRYWGGWGWGPGVALGLGLGAGYPYYYSGGSYYYGQGGDCGWVRTRVRRHGYWVVRRIWRCW